MPDSQNTQNWPIDSIMKAFRSGDPDTRREAEMVLEKIGLPAQDELITVLSGTRDEPTEVRAAAARILGRIDDQGAVQPLLDAMASETGDIQSEALNALEKFTAVISPEPLVPLLEHKDGDIRKKIAPLLDKTGWKPGSPREEAYYLAAKGEFDNISRLGGEAVEPLLNVLDNSSHTPTIFGVLDALEQIGDQRAVKSLINLLNHSWKSLPPKAAQVLVGIGLSHIEKPVLEILTHEDADTRKLAASILNQTGWKPSGNDNLSWFLVADQSWNIIPSMGAAAVEPLLHAAEDKSTDIRVKAIEALGKIDDARVMQPLLESLGVQEKTVVKAAANALIERGASDAVLPLLELLKQDDMTAKRTAVETLGKIGDVRALKPIFNLRRKLLGFWSDPPEDIYDNLVKPMGKAFDKIEALIPKIPKDGVCYRCMRKFHRHSFRMGFVFRCRYPACPQCHSASFAIKDVQSITLVLDHGMDSVWENKEGKLHINWYRRKEPCDFDEIRILDADDFEIQELVMKLSNLSDQKTRKSFGKTKVSLAPGVNPSQSSLNLLQAHFKFVMS